MKDSVAMAYAAACRRCDDVFVEDFFGIVIAWAREHSMLCGEVEHGRYGLVMADRAARRAWRHHELTASGTR